MDGADDPSVGVPILFWMSLTSNSRWVDISNKIVSLSVLVLLLSWAFLIAIAVPSHKKRTSS
jgi:hypothetical protein